MAAARVYRRDGASGKQVGSYHVTCTSGERVNLRTKNPTRALDRGRRARELGERTFVQDDTEGVDAPAPPPVKIAPPETAAAAAAAAASSAAVVPDAVIPPGPDGTPVGAPAHNALPPAPSPEQPKAPPAAGWADAANQAARADTPESSSSSSSSSAPEVDVAIDPAFIEQIIDQAAEICVELQLVGQEWLLKRTGKIKAGEVPLDGPASKGRLVGKTLYAQGLRKLIPADLPVPWWLAAPILTAALTMPVQVANGRRWTKEDQAAEDAAKAAAARGEPLDQQAQQTGPVGVPRAEAA